MTSDFIPTPPTTNRFPSGKGKLPSKLSIDRIGAIRIFNNLWRWYDVHSDHALAQRTGVKAAEISRIRNSTGALKLGPSMLLRLHEATGISAHNLRLIAAGKADILHRDFTRGFEQ